MMLITSGKSWCGGRSINDVKSSVNSSNYKGTLGLIAAISDLTKKDFIVSLPISEHAPFDLVASKDGVSYTVQVKYRRLRAGRL